MLITAVVVYLFFTLFIGYLASRKVKNATDFAVAGRNLSFFMSSSALLATWFGSETILGASEEFLKNGLIGVIEEPLGAGLCLIIVGAIYAKRMYRTNALTFSDVFLMKYGRKAEFISALLSVPSFFSWIAAQFVALGLVFQLFFGCSMEIGILVGALLVIVYTSMGGMWAVSLTDTIQMIVIILGFIALLFVFRDKVYLLGEVHQKNPDFFRLYNADKITWWQWLAAWMSVGLGSVASQDVFQRVISSKSERVAIGASITSGVLYLVIGMLPLFIALIGMEMYPTLYAHHQGSFIIAFIMEKTPIWVQIMFFGALISALLSTASGSILAPATILAENIIKPRFKEINLLLVLRVSVVVIALFGVLISFMGKSIFELAGIASSFTLVSVFVPFTAALFFPWVKSTGCIASMIFGLIAWVVCLIADQEIIGLFVGIAASLVGLIAGTWLDSLVKNEVEHV
jgi:Na+/proline symporter